jgi:hypothetical protein
LATFAKRKQRAKPTFYQPRWIRDGTQRSKICQKHIVPFFLGLELSRNGKQTPEFDAQQQVM